MRAEDSTRARYRRTALAVAGLLVGAAALALAFVRLGWDHGPTVAARVGRAELGAALGRTALPWLIAFTLANLASIPLRALQLKAIAIRDDGGAPRYAPCFRAVAIGVLANDLLPMRLGEAARALVLTRDGRVSLPRSAGALLVGRVLDLFALLAVSCALPALLALPAARLPSLRSVTTVGCLLGAALLLVVAALALGRVRIARALGRWPRLSHTVSDFAAALRVIGDRRRLPLAVVSSLAVPAALAASIFFGLRAEGIAAPAGTSLVFTGAMLLGVAVPSAPSSVGVYHALCVFLLGAFGIPAADAVAFALVTHATSTVASCLLGGACLGRARLLPEAAPEPVAAVEIAAD